MAVADPELDQFRHDFAALVGVPVRDVGMLPDQDHLEGGGYHCGRRDLIRIGKFHPPALAHVGSGNEDYSVRQLRDRAAVDDRAAAVDIPDAWGNGGNAAWISTNNLVLAHMQAGDPALAALRAMNFTPDGVLKRRYDTNNRAAGVIPSTDTVRWHTHWEFWRDLLGTPVMTRTLNRLLAITAAAIYGRPVPPEEDEEDEMGASFGPIDIEREGITSLTIPPVKAGAADPREAWLNLCNATGEQPYALRIFYSTGKADEWHELPGWPGGLKVLRGGQRESVQLPQFTSGLDIRRWGIDKDGEPVAPTTELRAYGGHLTVAIERGPVQR